MRTSELINELQALKHELSRATHAANERMADAARSGVEDVAGQLKGLLEDLGETLGEEEKFVESLIAERPMAAVASAFALGVAVGLMVRRRP